MENLAFFREFKSLTIEDFTNFIELSQVLSIRELARRKNQDPSTISRSLAALEAAFEQKLMVRGGGGMSLTEDGQRLLEILSRVMESMDALRGPADAMQILNIGSVSFLSNRMVALLVDRLETHFSEIRVVDFPPDELVASAIRGALNVVLHLGVKDWPQSWTSKKIGEISWVLCARKGHPLENKRNITIEHILKYPFVYPVYWGRSGFIFGDDGFPVSLFKRTRGFATSTAEAAAIMLQKTDQLSFLPDVIAYDEIRRGSLITIEAEQYKVAKPLYMAVRSDLLTQKNFALLAGEFTNFLKKLRI